MTTFAQAVNNQFARTENGNVINIIYNSKIIEDLYDNTLYKKTQNNRIKIFW
jgi:hypothetical protein